MSTTGFELKALRIEVQEQATQLAAQAAEIKQLNSQLVFEMETYAKVHKELTRQRDNLLAQVDEAMQDAARWKLASTSRNFGITNWGEFGRCTSYGEAAEKIIDAASKREREMKHEPNCELLEPASFGTMGNKCTCGEQIMTTNYKLPSPLNL